MIGTHGVGCLVLVVGSVSCVEKCFYGKKMSFAFCVRSRSSVPFDLKQNFCRWRCVFSYEAAFTNKSCTQVPGFLLSPAAGARRFRDFRGGTYW